MAEVLPSWRELAWQHRSLCAYFALSASAQALPMAAVSLLLSVELGLAARPELITAYYTTCFSATLAKPLAGAASDRLPPVYRRRGALLPACALAAVAQLGLGVWTSGLQSLFALGVLASLAGVAAETAADGALVEGGRGSAPLQARLQVLAMSCRSTGSALAAPLGSLLLRRLSSRAVVAMAAPLYAAAALACAWLPEAAAAAPGGELSAAAARRATTWRELGAALRAAAPASVVIFLLRLAPTADAYGTYLASQAYPADGSTPHLSATQLGWTYTLGSWSALAATLACGRLLGRRATLREMGAASVAAAALGLLRCAVLGAFGLPLFDFAALVGVALAAAGRVALMTQLVLYAQLAPAGREAAGFAAVAVLADLGALGGGAVTAALERAMGLGAPPARSWARLPAFVALCAALQAAPLLLLPWVPQPQPSAEVLVEEEVLEQEEVALLKSGGGDESP